MHALPKSVVQTLLNWTADSGADIGDQDLDQLDIGALLLFQVCTIIAYITIDINYKIKSTFN